VAQKIDDDNKLLQLKNQELKIQFASQEDDRDLLLRQLIYYKKENQKMRESHAKLKKQAEKLQEAERAEQAAKMLDGQKSDKPATAGGLIGSRLARGFKNPDLQHPTQAKSA